MAGAVVVLGVGVARATGCVHAAAVVTQLLLVVLL